MMMSYRLIEAFNHHPTYLSGNQVTLGSSVDFYVFRLL
jgi:hypothetical protein